MDKVTISSIADSKPSFVVSTQAAAAITVGAGELAIFVGTDVKNANNQRVVTALFDLEEALREAQYPVGPLAINTAEGVPPGKTGYAVTNVAALGVGHGEDEVIIAYGATFYDAGNSSNIGNIIRRGIEVIQEQVLKLN